MRVAKDDIVVRQTGTRSQQGSSSAEGYVSKTRGTSSSCLCLVASDCPGTRTCLLSHLDGRTPRAPSAERVLESCDGAVGSVCSGAHPVAVGAFSEVEGTRTLRRRSA